MVFHGKTIVDGLGSVGGSTNTIVGPQWGSSNGCRFLGVASGFLAPAEGNTIIDIDDANGSGTPTFDTGAGPPINGFSFMLFRREYGMGGDSALFCATPFGYIQARDNAVANTPVSVQAESFSFAHFMSGETNVMALEDHDATTIRFRSIAGYTEFLFFQNLTTLGYLLMNPPAGVNPPNNGQLSIEGDNVQVKFVRRGTDGVVRRSASITMT